MIEYVGKLLVDAENDQFTVQQLDVEFDFTDETTANAVLDDLEEALAEMGMRLHVPRPECAICFGDPLVQGPNSSSVVADDDVLLDLPDVRAFYDLSARAGVPRVAQFTVVRAMPQHRRMLRSHHARMTADRGERAKSPSPPALAAGSPPVPRPEAEVADAGVVGRRGHESEAQERDSCEWTGAYGGSAPPSSFRHLPVGGSEVAASSPKAGEPGKEASLFPSVPSWASDVNRPCEDSASQRAAALVAIEAERLLRQKELIVGRAHWATLIEAAPDRKAWLQACRDEAAAYNRVASDMEGAAQAIDAEQAKAVAAAENAVTSVMEQVEQRKLSLGKRRVLQERLDRLKTELDVLKEREAGLLAEAPRRDPLLHARDSDLGSAVLTPTHGKPPSPTPPLPSFGMNHSSIHKSLFTDASSAMTPFAGERGLPPPPVTANGDSPPQFDLPGSLSGRLPHGAPHEMRGYGQVHYSDVVGQRGPTLPATSHDRSTTNVAAYLTCDTAAPGVSAPRTEGYGAYDSHGSYAGIRAKPEKLGGYPGSADVAELRALAARLSQHFRGGTSAPEEREQLLYELRSVRERLGAPSDASWMHSGVAASTEELMPFPPATQPPPMAIGPGGDTTSALYRDPAMASIGHSSAPPSSFQPPARRPQLPANSFLRGTMTEGTGAIRWGSERVADSTFTSWVGGGVPKSSPTPGNGESIAPRRTGHVLDGLSGWASSGADVEPSAWGAGGVPPPLPASQIGAASSGLWDQHPPLPGSLTGGSAAPVTGALRHPLPLSGLGAGRYHLS